MGNGNEQSYDAIIAGGAIMGSAIAYFLTRDPGCAPRTLVIERDPSYARCSTTLSAASIRQQFSTPENIEISKFGIEFLRTVRDLLSPDADIGLKERGYLFLATAAGAPVLRSNHAVQCSRGVDVALMDAEALSRRFPWMNVDDLAAGCLGLSGEGWFDPYALLMAFRAKARAQGAVYETGTVAGLTVADRRISSVRLADDRSFACGDFVNATGPAAARTAALAGIDLPVECRKRCVFVVHSRDSDAVTRCPLVIDPSGVYFRPEGQYFITGVSPPAGRDPECWDFDVDHTLFDDIVWPVLARRAPAFEAIKVVNAWAGHYAYNVLDRNAVLGRHPEISNFIFANGFSGHGLQQAPAVGRGLAEVIIHGGYRSLDLSAFRFERFAENRPIREANVV